MGVPNVAVAELPDVKEGRKEVSKKAEKDGIPNILSRIHLSIHPREGKIQLSCSYGKSYEFSVTDEA